MSIFICGASRNSIYKYIGCEWPLQHRARGFYSGEVKIDTAERVKMTLYTEPPKLTEEQIARAEEFMDEPRIYPELAVVAKPKPPELGTETTVIEFNSSLAEARMESIEKAPTPFILARNVTSLPSGYTSKCQ